MLYIVATFEHCIYVELALTELEQKGIERDWMLAIPMKKRSEPVRLFDTIHYADGFSLIDLSAVFGTCLMLLGAIYGFVLAWGPIIWGIIGAVAGITLGIGVKMLLLKKSGFGVSRITAEIVLLIRCEEQQRHMVEDVLWDNKALGVARAPGQPYAGEIQQPSS